MPKIIVMSDIHLGPEGCVKFGLDTGARFAKALEDAARLHGDADLVVFAGDIADQAEPDAYARFEAMRARLDLPQRVMIGNHDDRPVYLAGARDPMRDPSGFVQGSLSLEGTRVVMLDSTEPGHVEGILCETRLSWLAEELAAAKAAQENVILLMHHNVPRLGMPVDRYSLTKPEALRAVLDRSGARIALIMAGHCHVTSAGSWAGYPMATISGNQHRVEAFLRGRTGQQISYEGPAQYGVILADEDGATVHFHNYIDRNIALPDAMFPWKKDQPFEA